MVIWGGGLVIAANLIFCVILGEVNGRDPSNQISLWFVNTRFFYVLRRHAEFFPNSRKRAQMKWLFIAGFGLAIAGVLIAVVRNSKMQ
jgi:hypothetical protein